MIRHRRFLAAALLAAFLSVASAAITLGQTPTVRPLHSKVTPAEKQASNNLVSQAISQLSAAQGAISNPAAASVDVNSALADLTQALPIYHGYRVKAMEACRRALRQLSHPKRVALAGPSISTALSNANTALQNAGDEVNERG